MLRVRTYVDKSKIKGAGIGLFAEKAIKRGTLIWTFDEDIDICFPISEFDNVMLAYPEMQSFISKYAYRESNLYIISFDNARFINHSNNPNLNDRVPFKTYAMKNISAGEELLSDYSKLSYKPEDAKFNLKL